MTVRPRRFENLGSLTGTSSDTAASAGQRGAATTADAQPVGEPSGRPQQRKANSSRERIEDQRDERSMDAIAGAPAASGRPQGKRSDDRFKQVSAYVEKELHQRAQIKSLSEHGSARKISDVVNALLRRWVAGEIKIDI